MLSHREVVGAKSVVAAGPKSPEALQQMGSIDGELPLKPEIPLRTGAGVAGYDGDKQRAGLYLLPDGRIPAVTAAQLALVEPYLNAGRTQALADSLSGLGVFGRIAEEDASLAASG